MSEEGSVLRKICTHLNAWEDALCLFLPESGEGAAIPANGESLPGKALPAASVTALSGAVRDRVYVDGSYIGVLPFAVSVRIGEGTPASRLTVLEFYDRLAAYLAAYTPSPDETRIYRRCRMTALPARASIEEDGSEEYRASFAVEYRHTPDA